MCKHAASRIWPSDNLSCDAHYILHSTAQGSADFLLYQKTNNITYVLYTLYRHTWFNPFLAEQEVCKSLYVHVWWTLLINWDAKCVLASRPGPREGGKPSPQPDLEATHIPAHILYNILIEMRQWVCVLSRSKSSMALVMQQIHYFWQLSNSSEEFTVYF